MAAYAALVSLMHIIEQIQHHPRPPISLDRSQAESLIEKVAFLQDFLEGYSHVENEEADALQSCIADAAYAAEDIIESHAVDQILAQSTSTTHGENMMTSIDFYQGLQKVIEDMYFIKKEVMEIQEKMGIQNQLHRNSMPVADSLSSPSKGHNTMVGFDDALIQLLEKLTGQQADRQIISIVGMGGIGKTTLARNICENPLIAQHFDVHAWVTISQEYTAPEILLELLCQINQKKRETFNRESQRDLGIQLHKSLSGRRYLIVMDDIWSIDVWDKVKFFFPDNNKGSRIMITTRLTNVGLYFTADSNFLQTMKFLGEDKSWNLLCKNVFGEKSCPSELEEIGKKIAKNCEGLPLSIVVTGGLLAKSKLTQEYWEYIAENLNEIVNLDDNERCLKILYMSYNRLPVHLKPCFLYMGIFLEDSEIYVNELIKLWIAEGFLKPVNSKSLEEVAEEYLINLIDRNLILVSKRKSNGQVKSCKIHDLLRDLCLREAEKDKFFSVIRLYGRKIPRDISTERRVAINEPMSKEEYSFPVVLYALEYASLTRSLICNFGGLLPSLNFRLLRVLTAFGKHSRCFDGEYSLEGIFQLVNSRYLAIRAADWGSNSRFPSSFYLLWNLQTLVVKGNGNGIIVLPEFWKMSQLRHVEVQNICLADPPCSDGRDDDFVLGNLQTLLCIEKFKCGEEVVKRIPNIKKLEIQYNEIEEGRSWSHYCLKNLGRLHKLESLSLFFPMFSNIPSRSDLLQNVSFPHSLKKLKLISCRLEWEDVETNIGLLPHLEVLKLTRFGVTGRQYWETVEGQFRNLKRLVIAMCGLQYWITDSTHFPRLERLALIFTSKLKEIPWGIGEIPTLQLIELEFCKKSAIISAKQILEEQEELGNEDLKVNVFSWKKTKVVDSLASNNFRVRFGKDKYEDEDEDEDEDDDNANKDEDDKEEEKDGDDENEDDA